MGRTNATAAWLLLALPLALLAGCEDGGAGAAAPASGGAGEGEATDEPAEPPEPDTDEQEHEPPDPDDPLAQRVHEVAAEAARDMKAASPMYEGDLEHGGVRDYQAMLKSVHCYRAVAAASEGVEDLDLRMLDPNNVPVSQDRGQDRTPVLGLSHPVCPKGPGMYRIQVKMFEGSGEYRMRLFRTK